MTTINIFKKESKGDYFKADKNNLEIGTGKIKLRRFKWIIAEDKTYLFREDKEVDM